MSDLAEGRQGFKPLAVGSEGVIIFHAREARMRLVEETQGNGDGDIGMADAISEPIICRSRRPVGLELRQRAENLAVAALDPDVRDLLMKSSDTGPLINRMKKTPPPMTTIATRPRSTSAVVFKNRRKA